ncbi:MAG: hypothetical protein WC091_01290 [Sulfuricellaceae bacterium]
MMADNPPPAKRGRKPNVPQVIEHAEVDQTQIDNAMVTLRADAQGAQELALQIGYDGTLTVAALEDGIRFYQNRTVEACLELGKRLVLLKEITPHGEFIGRMEVLGISDRMARKFMAAVLKFSNRNSSSVLQSVGSQTKLLELVVLDDGEIEALENGDSARGLTLDAIEVMSVRELKAALRDSRDENAANRELLADKNALLDDARANLARIKKAKPDVVLGELRREVNSYALTIEAAIIGQLRQGFLALQAHHESHPESDSNMLMAGLVGNLENCLRTLVDECMLPKIPVDGQPGWYRDQSGAAAE